MNIYDFDNTIFKGDSSIKFIKYSFFRHPLILMWSILKGIKESIKYLFHQSSLGEVKGEIFSFVKYIKDLDNYVNKYILTHQKYIKEFYLKQKKYDDTIISASFDFIIEPFCKSLGIKNVIATKYDTKCGKIIGKNCKGKEKIVRFKEKFKNVQVKKAYSDSLSDIPMFEIAQEAYLVKNDKLIKYNKA